MNPNEARLLDMINVLSTLRELAEMTTFDDFKKTLAAAEQQYRRWLDRCGSVGGRDSDDKYKRMREVIMPMPIDKKSFFAKWEGIVKEGR